LPYRYEPLPLPLDPLHSRLRRRWELMHLSCGAFPPSRELEQHLLNVSPIEYEYSHACDVTLQPNARQLACWSVGITSWRSRSCGFGPQQLRLRVHRRSRWLL
jgi:hypothetical protein